MSFCNISANTLRREVSESIIQYNSTLLHNQFLSSVKILITSVQKSYNLKQALIANLFSTKDQTVVVVLKVQNHKHPLCLLYKISQANVIFVIISVCHKHYTSEAYDLLNKVMFGSAYDLRV